MTPGRHPTESPIALLARGAAELGVLLAPAQLEQFSRYLTELDVWNRRMNLTGTRDPRELVTHHVLDSLAGDVVLRDLPDAAEVADLGSGAGFPGVPLAIARPGLRFTLIEPRGKRAAFLLHVVGVLGLSRVSVVDRTIDPRDPGVYARRFARVLARAVADPVEAIGTARPLLGTDGQVVVWVSDKQAAEAPEEFHRVPYRLPGTPIARVLLVASAR